MSFHKSPAAITLLYAALAGLWIVASGTLLAFSVEDPLLQGRIEVAKGLAFVAITSAFLYFALKSRQLIPYTNAANDLRDPVADTVRRRTVPLLLALALTVPLIALAVFTLSSRQQEQQVLNDLQAIASLKAEQLQVWVDERLGDASALASDSFSERVWNMQRTSDARETTLVRKRLQALHRYYDYDTVQLLDQNGNVLIVVGRPLAVPTHDTARLQKALATGKTQMSDILRDTAGSHHLDFFVPLQIEDADRKLTVGALVLHVDPARFLYPMLAGWPAVSASGEAYLVRREDQSVIWLSPPRHAAAAFNPRQPLSDTWLPASAAVQSGKPGAKRAVDYRGTDVLAAWWPVPGTEWLIVAKVDHHEAMAPARQLAAWAGLIALFAVAIVFAAVVALAREQQRAQHLALQLQSDRLLKQFYDLPFIGMAISSPDSKRWLNFNDQLCVIFGYSREELAQKTWAEMTHPDDLAKDVTEFERVMRGESDGYRLNKRFIRKDGTVVHAVIDVKCVLKPGGAVDYFVCMVQDITATKAAELDLLESETRFRTLAEQSPVGIYVLDGERISYANPRAHDIFGQLPGAMMNCTIRDMISEEDLPRVADKVRQLMSGEVTRLRDEFTIRRGDGATVIVGADGMQTRIDGKPVIIGMLQDITDKLRAEQDVRDYIARIERMITGTVTAMSSMVELRDPYTAGHERRVGELSAAIAAEMGLDDKMQTGLHLAGAVHDVGKIAVPAEILVKPGRLLPMEYELIKSHAQQGYEVLRGIDSPWPIAEVARQHHERIDGSGYPRGLKDGEILLEARILAVADVVESMGSHRPYRAALGIDKALAEIERGAGTLFDPQVAAACVRLFRDKNYRLPD
jgi:PAS domain S-box-containing protein